MSYKAPNRMYVFLNYFVMTPADRCSCWDPDSGPLPSKILAARLFSAILFNMYTAPLSTLISSQSLNHHLYADDTHIFIYIALKPLSAQQANLKIQSLTISDRIG